MIEAALGVVGTIAAAAITWLVARTQARAATSAATATARSADLSGAADAWKEIADDHRTRLTEVEARLAAVTHEQEAELVHSREQDRAIDDLRALLSRWVSWGQDLVARWDDHRAHESPPPLPELPEPPTEARPAHGR